MNMKKSALLPGPNVSRHILVSGASTGIGEAIAEHLAGIGVHVFAGIRNPEDGDKLSRMNSSITPVVLDVTNEKSIFEARRLIVHHIAGQGIHGLVNNAGIVVAGPLEFLPLADIREQFEVNVIGHLAVMQCFLPLLRRNCGRIVNIGSISGKVAMPFLGPYAASKFALEALTDSLRVELHRWQISVSLIEPGNISTPLWQRAIARVRHWESTLSSEARILYQEDIDTIFRAIERMMKTRMAPECVAKATAHALLSRHPKTRYAIGSEARLMMMLASLLPDRFRDWMVMWRLGLTSPRFSKV